MKEQRLLKILGEIDEKYVEEAAPANRAKKANKKYLIKWGVAAACLCLLCVSAIIIPDRSKGDLPPDNEITAVPDMEQASEADDVAAVEEQETFVPISSLLSVETLGMEDLAALIGMVPIGKYTGVYEKVESVESIVLSENKGKEVSGTEGWYYVSGHTDLQYLIRNDNEEYSLWEFAYFDSDEYPYCDVLELVYRIDSADMITEIKVNPPKMDNTDEGIAIQDKIGNHTITDREQIDIFYGILSSMICYGSGHWDMIDYGAEDMPADAGSTSHQAVKLGRYLSIVIDYGNEIDSLKYTAVSDMFYEFSGIAYNRLTKEQAASVCEIIGIATNEEQNEPYTSASNVRTVVYSQDDLYMSVDIPNGWDYKIKTKEDMDKEDGLMVCAIDFWSESYPETVFELGYVAPFGICGTGVTIEKYTLPNGLSGCRYTEELDGTLWLTITLNNPNNNISGGNYLIDASPKLPVWEIIEPEFDKILESIWVGSQR